LLSDLDTVYPLRFESLGQQSAAGIATCLKWLALFHAYFLGTEWMNTCLNDCPYQTLVHGDAKVANFCFSENGEEVAAVDFQYVGGGVGIRDVVYLLSSCLDEDVLFREGEHYLDIYFTHLHSACELYAVAWTDFYRFLLGWMPDHPKTHRYTTALSEQAIAQYQLREQ